MLANNNPDGFWCSMKLTVAVTTYNRWDSCGLAVRSIVEQDIERLDLLLVDDASQDALPTSMSLLIENNGVIFSSHTQNGGLSSARNTALGMASGDLFSFCDDDDQWPRGLASRLIEAMESAPDDVGMAVVLPEERKVSCGQLFEGYPRLSELMKAGLTPPVGSQIYRTELLREVGGYRPEVSSGVDHDLWISLARIDPRVAVAWGEPAIVGADPSRERMTTVEHRRRAGIEKSLAIWRDDLCEVFGEAFYRHFVRSYRWYLDYTFFIKSIQKREYLDTLKRAFRSPWLPLAVLRRRWERIAGRSHCTLFPEFKGD